MFQVVGGVLLGDTVVVAERSTATLRYYDTSGANLGRVGGKGDGPGEFSRLRCVQRVGRSLFAYDLDLNRVSKLDRDGIFLSSVRLESVEDFGRPTALGVFRDGSILVQATVPGRSEPVEGVVAPQFVLFRYGRNGLPIDTLTRHRSTERHVAPWGNMGRLRSELVFGERTAVGVARSRYYVLESGGPDITIYDTAGAKIGVARPDPPRPGGALTRGDLSRAREHFLRDETPQLQLGPVFDDMPEPDSLPH